MNRDDIICLAAEAGFSRHQFGGMFDVYLERFAMLIAKEEREKCAIACEQVYGWRDASDKDMKRFVDRHRHVITDCADAIRARKDEA